jgi:hypothetical protein
MNEFTRSESPSVPDLAEWGRVAVVGVFILAFVRWAEDAGRRYHRGQLLAAYRRRHAWKKSDISHLKSLGVNKAAQSRMERLVGTGRPVVKPHRPLDELIMSKVSAFNALVDKAASVEERRKAFKIWPWWPHYVEALYRGEHSIAKERGIKSPSTEAEFLVGAALGVSSATVHSICGEIRSMRKDDEDSANFPTMTLTEYNNLIEKGMGD